MKTNFILFVGLLLLVIYGVPLLVSHDMAAWAQEEASDQMVSYADSSGRQIQGLLQLPARSSGLLTGGVVLFSPSRSSPVGLDTLSGVNDGMDQLADALRSEELAVLRVQVSVDHPVQGIMRQDKNRLEQRVAASIDFLKARCGENNGRIAVVAQEEAADVAILGARMKSQVRSVLLLSGRLSQEAKESLVEWKDTPILCVISSEDKIGLRDMTDIYFARRRIDTEIRILEEMGRGSAMFKLWAEKYPQREPIERTIAQWLRHELSSVGHMREVSFMTEDGWKIFGNLRLPELKGKDAPGVILLHSGRSDRYVFANLERLLVKAGLAVLNIDWRGRGKSINKGKYMVKSKGFHYTVEERTKGTLDAKAAVDFLTSQKGVDKNHIGFVGIAHGAEHAVGGSIGDPRVKAFVLLTSYWPPEEKERARQSAYLTSGQVHVMYVTCKGHGIVTEAMRSLYQKTPDKLSQFLLYEGGAFGYQLFELDEKLEPTIVQWLEEVLVL